MTYEVVLTDKAHEQLERAYRWWADHRSVDQANRWYNVFVSSLERLGQHPETCALSPENGVAPCEIRDLYFGVGRRPTHRAVFTVRETLVVVHAIRHLAQSDLTTEDI